MQLSSRRRKMPLRREPAVSGFATGGGRWSLVGCHTLGALAHGFAGCGYAAALLGAGIGPAEEGWILDRPCRRFGMG